MIKGGKTILGRGEKRIKLSDWKGGDGPKLVVGGPKASRTSSRHASEASVSPRGSGNIGGNSGKIVSDSRAGVGSRRVKRESGDAVLGLSSGKSRNSDCRRTGRV